MTLSDSRTYTTLPSIRFTPKIVGSHESIVELRCHGTRDSWQSLRCLLLICPCPWSVLCDMLIDARKSLLRWFSATRINGFAYTCIHTFLCARKILLNVPMCVFMRFSRHIYLQVWQRISFDIVNCSIHCFANSFRTIQTLIGHLSNANRTKKWTENTQDLNFTWQTKKNF